MKKRLFILLMMLLSKSVLAEWALLDIYLETSESSFMAGKTKAFYIDPDTIRKNGKIAKMWSLQNYSHEQKFSSGKKYYSIKVLNEYDCDEELMRFLFNSFYSGSMGYGLRIHANNFSSSVWEPIEPGSPFKLMQEIACSKLSFTNSPHEPNTIEWLKVYESSESTTYINPLTIEKNYQFKRIWVLYELKQHLRELYGTSSISFKKEYDCNKEKNRILVSIFHFGSMGTGLSFSNNSITQKPYWASIETNSHEITMLDIVCDDRS